MKTIEPGTEYIDSRDVIARIEELQSERDDAQDHGAKFDSEELDALIEFAMSADGVDDWKYGAQFVHESVFVDHIKELIADCYEVKESSEWPYRHMEMDYEAAADEARQDYTEIDWRGETYLVR